MKKIFFLCCFMLSCAAVFSMGNKGEPYHYDKKTGIVADNNNQFLFKVECAKSVTMPWVDDYYFRNKNGELLISFKYATYRDIRLFGPMNPHGSENYFEIKFFGKQVVEAECHYKFLKGLVKMVYEKDFIKNESLDLDKVNEFSVINGTSFSKRRAELYSSRL